MTRFLPPGYIMVAMAGIMNAYPAPNYAGQTATPGCQAFFLTYLAR